MLKEGKLNFLKLLTSSGREVFVNPLQVKAVEPSDHDKGRAFVLMGEIGGGQGRFEVAWTAETVIKLLEECAAAHPVSEH